MKEYKEGDFFEHGADLYRVGRGNDCLFYNKATGCCDLDIDAGECSMEVGLGFRHTTSQERQEYYASDASDTVIDINKIVKEKIAASKEILEQTKKSLINEMADEIKEDIIKILIEELRCNI